MASGPNKIDRFWQELKRRKVIQVIIVYATAAFVIIELVNNVFEPLRLPDWTPTMVIVILAVGFPFAIIFSWIFDISLKGIVKTESIEPDKEPGEDYSLSDKTTCLENSIAVLPFQDMSPQNDQEYFCEGMAEELINALTKVARLQVASRTSAFQFKGKGYDIGKIGKELNVHSVLEGSIRKAGNKLRITAQLINVSDGYHLWSEKYDRDMEDIFAIQDEISLAIVDNLKVKLLWRPTASI
jgi:TolB-like protein